MTWLPTFNSDVLNLSASLSIQMASILAASIALGRFIAGIILKKVDWYILLSICLCSAAALVLMGISKNASQTRFEPIECSITVGP